MDMPVENGNRRQIAADVKISMLVETVKNNDNNRR